MRNLVLAALTIFAFQSALAADPAPNADKKEKVEDIQQSGALKIEQKPAVSPESLKGEPTPLGNPPAAPAPTEEKTAAAPGEHGAPHYFGLHAALGLPHPITYGVDYVHSSGYFSAGFSVGSYSAKSEDVDVSLANSDLALRWHPFAGAFYLGVMVGKQTITAKKAETVTNGIITETVNAEIKVESNTMTPHLGWMWGVSDGGLFVSFDLGMQNPSGVTTTFTTDAPPTVTGSQDYRDLEDDVKKKGNDIGNTSLPYIGLLKIGYLF